MDIVEKIARMINPEWFWPPELGPQETYEDGTPRHPLDNYKGQSLRYQERAKFKASQIIDLIREDLSNH